MPTQRSHISTIALTLLSTLIVVMGVYILFRFIQTNKMPEPVTTTEPTTPTIDPGTAFIRIMSATTPVIAGQSVTVTLDSNDWASCEMDMYRPDQTPYMMTKEASAFKALAPGHFSWTWAVPAGEAKGTWNGRVLCGRSDNLATVDQALEVR